MNREHVRPIVAFCSVAVAATVVTALGLSADPPQIELRAGVPSAVQTTDDVPGLVLGSSLAARPALAGRASTVAVPISSASQSSTVRTVPASATAGAEAPASTVTRAVKEARASASSAPAPPRPVRVTDSPGRGKGSANAHDNAGASSRATKDKGGKGRR